MHKYIASALMGCSLIWAGCSRLEQKSEASKEQISSRLTFYDLFSATDETLRHPPPPEGLFMPEETGTLMCPVGGLVHLSQEPEGEIACAVTDGAGELAGCAAPCVDCDAAKIGAAVDEFLEDEAFQDDSEKIAPDATTDEQALKKCFRIAQFVKYKKDKFDCRHFAYYAKACLKRFMNNVWTAGIFCKNCDRTDLYENGGIGHSAVGYYSSELGKCCMAEPSSSYPDAAIVCEDAARLSDCHWSDLLKRANEKYCSGDWFGDPERKRGCVVDAQSRGWGDDRVTCDRTTQKCLVDNDILPAAQCVGSYRCEGGQWVLRHSDATQCGAGVSCLNQLPGTQGACSTAGASTTFTAPCP
jgi:hypothetical protein